MKHFSLKSYLSSNLNISETDIATIIDLCPSKIISKNEYVLRQGEICTHTVFVEKGLLRQYTIDSKGKEHILYFAPENWFLVDRESNFFNQPSNYFIQALEDTTVRVIGDSFMHTLSEKIPNFIEFNNKLLHNHIRHLQNRVTQLQGATAEERYLHFIKLYPDILLRVPQALVASYLGITPEGLSRVRKELANKHRF